MANTFPGDYFLNHDLGFSGIENTSFSIGSSSANAFLSAENLLTYDTGDPCKQKGALGGVAKNIEKLFIVLKSVKKYGNIYINGSINKVAKLQSQIRAITSAIAGILKTLIQRLRNWVLNKLKALIEQAINYLVTNFIAKIKESIVSAIIDQIFCAFEKIITGLGELVGDFLYSLIGQIINAPFCAAEQWTNSLLNKLVNDIDNALEPLFGSINDLLSGVGSIAGSVFQAIDFILGFQGFLCGAPDCPEVREFSLAPFGGPVKSFTDDFSNFNFISDNFAGEITAGANKYLDDFFGPESGTLDQSPGSCYTGTFECGIPQIEIFGGGGSGAVGQAVVNKIGEVVGVNLLSGGSGYKSAPFVSIIDPAGCGTNAAAFSILATDGDGYSTGSVSEIVLTSPGYNYSDSYNGGAPVIASFKASPNPIVVGNTVILSWSVTNADTVSLGIEGYTNLPLSGSVSIPITSNDVLFEPNSDQTTITYTLTAKKDNLESAPQTTTQTFILTVLESSISGSEGLTNTNQPIIDSFIASPNKTSPGSIVTLSWQTSNTTNVSIDVDGGNSLPADGSFSLVIPSDIEFPQDGSSITNTYTITAVNSNAPLGYQTVNQTVTVEIGTSSINTTQGDSTTGGGSGVSGVAATDSGIGTSGIENNTSGTGNNDAVAIIDGIDIIGTGIGYSDTDTVTITDDTGVGASAEIQTNQLGQIVGINLLSSGYGFTRIPEISINSLEGVGVQFRPKLKFIPLNQFLLEEELQVIDPNKLVQVVDCVSR